MKKLLVVLFMSVALVMFFGSCKKGVKTEPVAQEPEVEKVEEVTPQVEKPELTEEEIFERMSLEEINKEGHLKKINFDFDKYYIRDDMKATLHRNADWLLKHPSVEIKVEGHCDERGTVEYNIALGEKRASTAKEYLVSLGVPAERMNIVSYGKNRPLIPNAADEDSHFQNRRAEFIIVKK
jgi:peptidoglycan-associated lipoprotein